MHNVLTNFEIRVVGAPLAASSSIDNNSSRIDMKDYDAVTFITVIDDSVATGVAGLKIEQSDEDSDTNMALVSGSAVTKTSAVNDDINGLALVTEVFRPTKRYVQAVRTSSTANIAFGSVIAILKPRVMPVTQGSTIAATALVTN